jgi:hydrogenase expression/formation protein HypE
MVNMLNEDSVISCPVPREGHGECVLLAHGEGGSLMRRFIQNEILPTLDNEYLRAVGDSAVMPPLAGHLAFSTDSFVVSPLFFPGGDIGSLAIYGTVNDLAMAGARPLWMSLALILEEGLELAVLRQVLISVANAARRVGAVVVTGDTKVVPRGAADRMFLTVSGIGEIAGVAPPGPAALHLGDEIIVSGSLARHGIAVLAAREGFDFDPAPISDSAPLVEPVMELLAARIPVRALRDATRGGLGAVLHEWAHASGMTLAIVEELLPIDQAIRGACELLGLDPIHIANEGTMVIAVPNGESARAIEILHRLPETRQATRIGKVEQRGLAPVAVQRLTGCWTPLDEPPGAPLPRIC